MAYDKIDDINSVLCGVYQAAAGVLSRKSARHFLLMSSDMEMVLDLALRNYGKLLNIGPEKSIRCDYILHLLLWTLQYQDRAEILSKISNENITKLKDAISVVKGYPCPESGPDKAEAKKLTKEYHTQNRKLSLPPEQRSKNTTARYSDLIMYRVAEIWPETVAVLDEWVGAIDIYQNNVAPVVPQEMAEKNEIGVQKMPEINGKDENKECLLSMAEVAEKLGFADTKAFYNKLYSLKTQGKNVDDYFVGPGRRKGKFLRVNDLPKLKELLNTSPKKRGRPSKSSDASVGSAKEMVQATIMDKKQEKPMAPDKVSKTDVPAVTEHPMDWVDIKGFEKYLEKLTQMKKNADDVFKTEKAAYDGLYTKLQEAENKKDKAKEEVDRLDGLVDEGTRLLVELTNAENAFNLSIKKVSEFLQANNACVK